MLTRVSDMTVIAHTAAANWTPGFMLGGVPTKTSDDNKEVRQARREGAPLRRVQPGKF